MCVHEAHGIRAPQFGAAGDQVTDVVSKLKSLPLLMCRPRFLIYAPNAIDGNSSRYLMSPLSGNQTILLTVSLIKICIVGSKNYALMLQKLYLAIFNLTVTDHPAAC